LRWSARRDQDARPIRTARAGGQRRHGRGLPRPRLRARPGGRGQAPPPAPRRGRREPRPLLARGPRGGAAVPPRHRRDLRLRGRRGPGGLPRHRVRARPHAAGLRPAGRVRLPGGRPAPRPGPRRRARARPLGRRHPPRPQAGERARPGGAAPGAQARRLRHRPHPRLRRADDHDRRAGGIAAPHGARDRRGAGGRRPQRPLLPRDHPVLAGHRPLPVRGQQPHRHPAPRHRG